MNFALDEGWIYGDLWKLCNGHPSNQYVMIVMMWYKRAVIGNHGMFAQLYEIVKGNGMYREAPPRPKAFFGPKQLAAPDVCAGFFFILPDSSGLKWGSWLYK